MKYKGSKERFIIRNVDNIYKDRKEICGTDVNNIFFIFFLNIPDIKKIFFFSNFLAYTYSFYIFLFLNIYMFLSILNE